MLCVLCGVMMWLLGSICCIVIYIFMLNVVNRKVGLDSLILILLIVFRIRYGVIVGFNMVLSLNVEVSRVSVLVCFFCVVLFVISVCIVGGVVELNVL